MKLLKETWRVFKEHFAPVVITIFSVLVLMIPPGIIMWLFPPTLIAGGLVLAWLIFAISTILALQEAWDNLHRDT